MKFDVNYNNGEIMDVVEAENINTAKTLFAKKLIDEGKVNDSVFFVRNKIKVNEKEDNVMNDKFDVEGVQIEVPDVEEVTENFVAPTPIAPVVEAVKRGRGRPVNPNSANQARLKAREAKLAAGIPIRRGRPINPNSVRQIKMQEKAQRAANKVLTGLESLRVPAL